MQRRVLSLALIAVFGLGISACNKGTSSASASATATPAGPATAWPGGEGNLTMDNVPVAPGAYPDQGGDAFSIKSKNGVKTGMFSYGIDAPMGDLVNWYAARLQTLHWHLRGVATPNAEHPMITLQSEHPGEALTVIIRPVDATRNKVTLLKLKSLH